MPAPSHPHDSTRAFTLVEIVIAIGVFSFAVVAIMGMFPIGINAQQQATFSARAPFIASQVYDSLSVRSSLTNALILTQGVVQLSTNGARITNATANFLTNNFTVPATSQVYLLYDAQGSPIGTTTAAVYNGGISGNLRAQFAVRIQSFTNTPLPGSLYQINVTVTEPALTTLSNRRTAVYSQYRLNLP